MKRKQKLINELVDLVTTKLYESWYKSDYPPNYIEVLQRKIERQGMQSLNTRQKKVLEYYRIHKELPPWFEPDVEQDWKRAQTSLMSVLTKLRKNFDTGKMDSSEVFEELVDYIQYELVPSHEDYPDQLGFRSNRLPDLFDVELWLDGSNTDEKFTDKILDKILQRPVSPTPTTPDPYLRRHFRRLEPPRGESLSYFKKAVQDFEEYLSRPATKELTVDEIFEEYIYPKILRNFEIDRLGIGSLSLTFKKNIDVFIEDWFKGKISTHECAELVLSQIGAQYNEYIHHFSLGQGQFTY